MSLNRREDCGELWWKNERLVANKPVRLSASLRGTFEFRTKEGRDGIDDGPIGSDERGAGDVEIPDTLPYPITAVGTLVFSRGVAIGNFL